MAFFEHPGSSRKHSAAHTTALIAAAIGVAFIAFAPQGANAQDKELVFGGFGGSFQKGLLKTVIKPFEKKFGVHVTYVTGTSNQLLAKVKAQRNRPEIDVIWANDTTHFEGKQQGLYAKLDTSKVTNLPQLYSFAKDPQDIGLVMGIQAIGLEYNTKVFKEKGWAPPTSWNDLWNPKYKGHVVVYNMPIGYANLMLGEIAKLKGGSSTNLEPGWKAFEALVPNALAFVSPPAQVDNLFSQGSAWIAFNGSARIENLKAAGGPVEIVYPKEGAVIYRQQFDIVKNAPHMTLAQEFVNYTISEAAQRRMAGALLLGPVNKNVKLSKEDAAKVPYGEKQVGSLSNIDSDPINKALPELVKRWMAMVAH